MWANSALYDYDALGRPVGKTINGQKTRDLHAGDMEIVGLDSAWGALDDFDTEQWEQHA